MVFQGLPSRMLVITRRLGNLDDYISKLLRARSENMSHLIKQIATSYITLYSQGGKKAFF